jgi:glycyl-tRNA synthetase
MVTSRDDVVGLDSSIILPRAGVGGLGPRRAFNDPLVECLNCHKRFRDGPPAGGVAEKAGKKGHESTPTTSARRDRLPDCGTKGQWTEPRPST